MSHDLNSKLNCTVQAESKASLSGCVWLPAWWSSCWIFIRNCVMIILAPNSNTSRRADTVTWCCWCCCRCRLQSDWSKLVHFWRQTCAILAPAGKRGSKGGYTQPYCHFFERSRLAGQGLLRCCAELTHTCSWKQSMATFSGDSNSLWRSHRCCAVPQTVLRLCCCHMDPICCSRNVADSSPPKSSWSHRCCAMPQTVETMLLSHGPHLLQQEHCWQLHTKAQLPWKVYVMSSTSGEQHWAQHCCLYRTT